VFSNLPGLHSTSDAFQTFLQHSQRTVIRERRVICTDRKNNQLHWITDALVLRSETYAKAHLKWPGALIVDVSAQRHLNALSGYTKIVESSFPVNIYEKFKYYSECSCCQCNDMHYGQFVIAGV